MSGRGRRAWWDDGPSTPIAVEGGVKARSKRGAIGEKWWSQRFIAILESYGMEGRLQRGRAYARRGQVIDFDLRIGKVTARVQGSRPVPYKVTIGILPLTTAQWKVVEARLAGAALFRAKLLAGEMPAEIEDVFAECGTPLFPSRVSDLDLHCTCPDWEIPCKHLAAVCYVLAEAFDEDPFGMLAWRGREKEDLLSALRRTASGSGPRASAADAASGPGVSADAVQGEDGSVSATRGILADVPGAPLSPSSGADFWSPGLSVARLRALTEAPTAASAPDLLLRMFEPPAVKVRNKNLRDVLAPAYERLASPGEEP